MDELIDNIISYTEETQWDFIGDLDTGNEHQVEDENEEIEVAVAPKDIAAENSERFSEAVPQKNKWQRNKKRRRKSTSSKQTRKI